jgi:hypothetical protein
MPSEENERGDNEQAWEQPWPPGRHGVVRQGFLGLLVDSQRRRNRLGNFLGRRLGRPNGRRPHHREHLPRTHRRDCGAHVFDRPRGVGRAGLAPRAAAMGSLLPAQVWSRKPPASSKEAGGATNKAMTGLDQMAFGQKLQRASTAPLPFLLPDARAGDGGACGLLTPRLFRPHSISSEHGPDVLMFRCILENIPTQMSRFKQQKKAQWVPFSDQTTARPLPINLLQLGIRGYPRRIRSRHCLEPETRSTIQSANPRAADTQFHRCQGSDPLLACITGCTSLTDGTLGHACRPEPSRLTYHRGKS